MRVSVNWMKWYGGQGLDVPTNELVTRIGSQLGEVEGVEDLGAKYKGVVVAKVVSCVDHPDADRLHVCTIDDGGITPDVKRDADGYVQVVCGAPNVREGLTVAWLPPGATVPDSVGNDPFVLEARELRGVVSNGMLASPKELALGDSHEGLLELDGDAKPGDDFAKAYGLEDTIIEIENKMFTHRPDCFGQLGVAREIAGIQGLQFKSPDWYLQPQGGDSGDGLTVHVENEIPSLVPRFMVLPMKNVHIKPSPVWLQTYLLRVGVRPISNVVDITNYMMLLTGQPMHAYDYDKVKALDGTDDVTFVIRNPRADEKIELLNGKSIDPRKEAIMIASKTKLIGLGGVMGGSETEVDENTKNIVLECASFDMYSIRRSSMAHGLFTDAVTRFNKGQSPLQNEAALAKAAEMLQELAGAERAGQVVDDNHVSEQSRTRRSMHPPVPVTAEFINARLGFNLSADDMKKLLENVEFQVAVEGDQLTVTAPFWRTDIETREDVVEEVGRLYGFDHLPQVLPLRSVAPTHRDEILSTKAAIRNKLSRSGANEILTYTFVHSNLFQKVGQDASLAFSLSNALSPDLQHYRLSLTPSLLEKVHPNVKAGYDEFALFEIGTVHGQGEVDEEGLPKGLGRVGFVCANSKSKNKTPYYRARTFATELLDGFIDVHELRFVPVAKAEADFAKHKLFQQMLAPYDRGRAAVVFNGEQPIGVVGEYKPGVVRALKLPADCAGFELFLSAFSKPLGVQYQPLSRFPKVMQDITLKVSADVAFADVTKSVREAVESAKPEHAVLSLSPLGIYQAPDDAEHKNLSFRLEIASYEKTMTDAEVAKLLDTAADATNKAVGAERI